MSRSEIIIIAGLAVALFGCDCVRRTSGVVIDDITGEPISDAVIKNSRDYKPASIKRTGTTGEFEYSDISGGVRCPPLHLAVMAEGYITQNVKCHRCGTLDTLRMRRWQ
jgi:hypothetical protein